VYKGNEMTTPKYIRTTDRSGRVDFTNVENLVAQQLNHFKGWTCNAGVQSLYIDYDGSVWVANCAGAAMNPNSISKDITWEWGHVGSIFLDEYVWPTGPVICPFRSCGCGADLCVSKNAQPVNMGANSIDNIKAVDSETDLVAVGMNLHWPKHVLWDIGRWCNYSCSYCWPAVHNKTDPHKKFDVMKAAVDRIYDEWSNGETVKWAFGGGEPTVNPDFLPLMEYIRKRGGYTLVVSNGSRNIDYYYKLAWAIDCLQLSLHTEFWRQDQFTANLESVLKAYKDKDGGWVDVKIMCKPGVVRDAVGWKNEFNRIIMAASGRARRLGYATLVPIRSIDDSGVLVGYDAEELDLLQKNA
jgi:hypothetical protein